VTTLELRDVHYKPRHDRAANTKFETLGSDKNSPKCRGFSDLIQETARHQPVSWNPN
jgi:hypothetical protein